jgi:hypothetical protein
MGELFDCADKGIERRLAMNKRKEKLRELRALLYFILTGYLS